MTRPRSRAAVWGALAVSALVLGSVGWFRAESGASRLPAEGVVKEVLPGMRTPARVVLDRAGVPHVQAENERDAWFLEGYLHARERFFGMEVSRRAASGRLAEIFGEAALPDDRKLRTWRLAAVARRQTGELTDGERDALDAYVAGVNAALDRWGRWIAPEIALLGVEPEPWKVEDSLGIGLLFQLGVSQAMGEEMDRAVELGSLGRARAIDLWGWTNEQARRWIPPNAGETPRNADDAIIVGMSGLGSNQWALAGSKTASGRPLLANDPHLSVSMPSPWFPIHLTAPGLNVAGVSLPGAPGIMIGHTDGVAWGFTMAMLDDQDLFQIELDPSGHRERWNGSWVPLQVVEERFDVLGWKEPIQTEVLVSRHGPVVRRRGERALALTWSALREPSPLGVFLTMDHAETVEQTLAAWQGAVGPGMNLAAADTEGHILHGVVGRVPERGHGAGRLPAPGNDPRWDWRGLRPERENPMKEDPDAGFVATANHDLFAEGDYPESEFFPGEFDSPWRIRRIRQVLEGSGDWTVAGCLGLQMDVVSERARTMLFLLQPELREHGGWTASVLLSWDGRMKAGSAAPFVLTRLMNRLIDVVGGDEARRAGVEGSFLGPAELVRLLAGALDPAWWDDVETPAKEDRAAIVRRVLDELDAEHDGRPWGAVHTVTFRHPLGRAPVMGPLLDRLLSPGPFPVGGDGSTVNRAAYLRKRPYGVAVIPSMRFVADVGAWDNSILIVPPGASGRPWSPHFDDQIPEWRNGGSVSLPFSRSAVEASAQAVLELQPAPGHS